MSITSWELSCPREDEEGVLHLHLKVCLMFEYSVTGLSRMTAAARRSISMSVTRGGKRAEGEFVRRSRVTSM